MEKQANMVENVKTRESISKGPMHGRFILRPTGGIADV